MCNGEEGGPKFSSPNAEIIRVEDDESARLGPDRKGKAVRAVASIA